MIKKIVAVLFLVASASLTLQAKDKMKTAEIRTKISCDHCKRCGSCSARLEKALYDQKGIRRVDIDDQTMNIKVVYNQEKISVAQIRNTIAASGYDADEVKAPAEAVARLDGCCRGAE